MRLSVLTLVSSAAVFAVGCSSGSGGGVGAATGGGYSVTGGTSGTGVPGSGGAAPGVGGDANAAVGGGVGDDGAGGGAATASGGATATGGSTSTEPAEIDCSRVGSGIPLNATGWVDSSCGTPGIQGAWYCFDDGIQASSCTDGAPPFQASGMCLSGTSVGGEDYDSWGGGIGLSLNETGGDNSVKTVYNATANGVLGFRITLEGDSLGESIRVGFTGALDPGDLPSPFVEVGELVPGAPVTVEVMIADALVPLAWDLENSGEGADPTTLFDLQIQYPGGETDGEYSFCITSVEPITDGSVPTVECNVSGLTQYGSTSEQYGQISAGSYMIQNDIWNQVNGASQTITAYQASGSAVAFQVRPNINVTSDEPASYPSAVYGWHYGTFYGGYGSAKQISSINAAPSVFEYCAPSDGRYDVSYDIWIHDQSTASAPGGGSTELMIWIGTRDATPIGDSDAVYTVSLAGATWEVWHGQNAGGWQTLSYRRVTNTPSVDFDLMDFVNHGVAEGYYPASDYLLGVEAGFEIWESTETFTTQRYSVSIN